MRNLGIQFQRRVYAALDPIGACNVPDSNSAPLRPRAACRDFFSIFRHIPSLSRTSGSGLFDTINPVGHDWQISLENRPAPRPAELILIIQEPGSLGESNMHDSNSGRRQRADTRSRLDRHGFATIWPNGSDNWRFGHGRDATSRFFVGNRDWPSWRARPWPPSRRQATRPTRRFAARPKHLVAAFNRGEPKKLPHSGPTSAVLPTNKAKSSKAARRLKASTPPSSRNIPCEDRPCDRVDRFSHTVGGHRGWPLADHMKRPGSRVVTPRCTRWRTANG